MVALWQTVAAVALVALLAGGLAIAIAQARTARREARKAEEVRRFLVDVFEVSDPTRARGQSVTARELLDRGAERIDATLAGEPEIRAEILGLLGDLYVKLGLAEPGLRVVERELDLLGSLPRRAGDRAGALRRRGALLILKGEWEPAERCLRDALERHRAAREGEAEVAEDLDLLSTIGLARGRREEAEEMQREALAIRRRLFGDDHASVATSLNNLAVLARGGGRLAEAEGLFRECLRIRRRALSPGHPDFGATLLNQTALLRQMGRYAEAEDAAREAVALHVRLYGEDHTLTAGAHNALGSVMLSLARWSEAEALFRKALAAWEAHEGRQHPHAIATINNVACALREGVSLDESEPLLREAVECWRTRAGARHPFHATGLVNLAALLRLQQRYEEAERALAEARSIQEAVHGPDHLETANVVFHQGWVAACRGDLESAERLLREAGTLRDHLLGASSHAGAICRAKLADVLARRGRRDEARGMAEEARAALAAALPGGHPDRVDAERLADRLRPASPPE
jgi:serine/threonine-protein kinase